MSAFMYKDPDTGKWMPIAKGADGKDGAQGPKGDKGDKGDSYILTEDDKAEIAGLVEVSSGTPNCIVEEARRVARNVRAGRTAKSLVFPVMSDIHLFAGNSAHEASLLSAKYAGMGVSELGKGLKLDFVGYLGDYTWGAADHTAQQVMADITAVKETTDPAIPQLWCVGNHDLNYGKERDRLLTLDEVYGYVGANSDGVKPYGDMERGYGYLDFENQKIRVIYLNTCDASDWQVSEGVAARSEWVSPTQIQWLADTALDFTGKASPAQWGVVILSHHPLHYGFSCFDSVMLLLEAYRDGRSGTLSCTVRAETVDGATTYPQQKVTYDFSGAERAEIICNIHGHNHNCGYSCISSSTRSGSGEVAPWLWRIGIPNISANRYNTGAELGVLYGEYDDSGNAVEWTKETGTAKATSFCVVNLDRKSKKIYVHIFGAGRDRVIGYGEEYAPAEYGISVTLSGCTAGSVNASTIMEDGTVTLSFTADDGYELPDSVTVAGASYTWDKASGTLTLTVPTADVTVRVDAVKKQVVNMLRSAYTSPTDSTIYGEDYDGDGVNDGYKQDTRYSQSQGIIAASGYQLTGIIPTKTGDLVRVKNIDTFQFCIRVKTDNTHSATQPSTHYAEGYSQPDENGVYTFISEKTENDFCGMRFSGQGIDGNTIITVNEPIE